MKKHYLLILIFIGAFNLHAQNYKYGKVSEEEVLATEHKTDKDANAAVLYRDFDTFYDFDSKTGFILLTEVHERIKIYNKDGFDWATKEISYYKKGAGDKVEVNSIKGETYYMENGKLKSEKLDKDAIFDEEVSRYRGKIKFTMPSVSEGCVIEYRYTKKSPFLADIGNVELQFEIPIDKLQVRVVIPEFFMFQKYVNPRSNINYKITEESSEFHYTTQQIERKGETQFGAVTHDMSVSKVNYTQNIYKVEKENIPALKSENYVDYLGNYQAFLAWELMYTKFPNSAVENYSQTWDGVVSKIYQSSSFGSELNRSNYFEDDVNTAISGISNPQEKIFKIFNLVKQKVKWNNYVGYYTDKGTKAAYKEGSGNTADINLMLVAMLRFANLDSNPVLVSTINNGVPMFPTQDGFNYVIAQVKVGDSEVLLDASDPVAYPNLLPKIARNWQGRLVRKDGSSEWVNLMPNMVSDNKTVLNLKFNDEMAIEGKVTNILNGYFAKAYRSDYLGLSAGDYLKILEENKGNIEINNVDTQNAKQAGQEITETYDFTLQNAMEMIGNKIYLKPLIFLANSENPFKADKRQYPIFFNYPSNITKTVNMFIPDGYELESMPESSIVSLNDQDGIYKFVVSQNGKFLRITSELQLNNIVYSPTDYNAVKDFYNNMVLKNSEAIVLNKI